MCSMWAGESSEKCELGGDLFLQYYDDSTIKVHYETNIIFQGRRQVGEMEIYREQILTRNETCSFAEPTDRINTVGNGA